jgi:uncharacterized protein
MTTPMTYPGVYLAELQSSQHPITGVATSITAFVGPAAWGPVNSPQTCFTWTDYVRTFGGMSSASTMSYAVYQFFQNGGATAIVIRVTKDDGKAEAATLTLPGQGSAVVLEAASTGQLGDSLQATVDNQGVADTTKQWNLTVQNTATGVTERYLNITTDTTSSKSLAQQLQSSVLVQVKSGGDQLPDPTPSGQPVQGQDGNDGSPITDTELDAVVQAGGALATVDLFNILCLLPALGSDVGENPLTDAVDLCVNRRAMLLVDPPSAWGTVDTAKTGMANPPVTGQKAANAAMYFPRVTATDPLTGLPGTYSSCGAVAGVWASTDSARGVWKAPAGTIASLPGGMYPAVLMTDDQNGELNPLGLNCLRTFPVIGPVVWGARTLLGSDAAESQWKYIPVRRTALYIEESLRRGTQWVVFEPNAEPLWSSIRLNVGAFMQGLYRQGAFAGATPSQAYLVKCDAENNPPDQVALGIVNILVGFAPLYPAEFVLISIEQLQLAS